MSEFILSILDYIEGVPIFFVFMLLGTVLMLFTLRKRYRCEKCRSLFRMEFISTVKSTTSKRVTTVRCKKCGHNQSWEWDPTNSGPVGGD